MFTFCSLYSGSSGNSSLIQTDKTKILVDAGGSCKKLENALESLKINPQEIDGIIITHEHSDHSSAIGLFSKKYDVPVYANIETWKGMEAQAGKMNERNIKYFEFKKFKIGDLTVYPFSIPHDAANPCGFNIFYKDKKISVATDVGHMTNEIAEKLSNSSFVMLESNYDTNTLMCSRYPYLLKQRISSQNGHLSNDEAGKTISYLVDHGVNNVMVGHLSRENNFPELAYKTIVEQLIENHQDESLFKLHIADRYDVSPIIDVG